MYKHLPLTWTHSNFPDRALLAGAATFFVLIKAGKPICPHRALGTEPTACYCSREDCSWYRILKEHHCLVVVGSSHIAGAFSLCPPLKLCNFLASFYIYSFAVSRGKGNNPHSYTEGKVGSFWQREVTLTKYFTNYLLNNCYPRLKRRHITTLKIVCSTAQPWKALDSVRAVKDLLQNCQRNYRSLSVS